MKKASVLAMALCLIGIGIAQTNIRIMGYGGQDPAIVQRLLDDVIGDRLAAEGITVSYEPLEGDYNAALFNALSAGTAADIFYLPGETAPAIVATGKVLALDGHIDVSPFIASLMDVYTFDGRVYGVPKDFNTLALVYNTDLFDEAGVEYPDEDDTWADFADKLRGVSALEDGVYGACFPTTYDRFGAFAFASGWQPPGVVEQPDFTDSAMNEAVDWYTGLIREGAAVTPADVGQGWTGGCLATEEVGVAIEGAWIVGFLRNDAPNLRYGATFLPLGPSGERGNFIYSVAYAVNSDSPNRDAALLVLEALTSPEAQQWVLEEGLAIPSRSELADNPFFDQDTPEARANRTVFQGAEQGNVYGFQFGTLGTDFMNPINDALSAIVTDGAEIDQALGQAQRNLQALQERAR
ncbi:MAG: extracellular solute-binding protein [Trueperaceae bacterium]